MRTGVCATIALGITIGFSLGCEDRAKAATARTPAELGVSTPVRAQRLGPEEKAVFSAAASGRVVRPPAPEAFAAAFAMLPWPSESAQNSVGWNFTEASHGEPVVLFIETHQRPLSALGRFKGNVLGRYVYDFARQSFVEDHDTFRVPRRFMELSAVYADLVPRLEDLATDVTGYVDSAKLWPFGDNTNYHGTLVFDIFATRAPRTKVVFAELPELENLLSCKSLAVGAAPTAVLRARLEALRSAYAQLIRRKGVTHISLSHIYTVEQLARVARAECPDQDWDTDEVVSAFIDYRRREFEGLDVRVFQGQTNGANQIRDERDWELFCPRGGNTIGVSYFSTTDPRIPMEGVAMTSRSPARDQAGNWRKGCSEMVINSGFGEKQDYKTGMTVPAIDEDRPYLKIPLNGAHRELAQHQTLMANSWAAPLATAFSLHVEENFRRRNGRFPTFAELRRLYVGRVFDPILHSQFETYYEMEKP